MVQVYGSIDCRRSHRAIRWLNARQIPFRFHDLHSGNIDAAVLESLLGAFSWQALVDKRMAAWRALAASVPRLTEPCGALELLSQRPQLLKTPILNVSGTWCLGWNASNKVRVLGRIATVLTRTEPPGSIVADKHARSDNLSPLV